ncbi:hypothetical protein [Shewanella colwelliana]|uniref:hypothetical protein n=1 Tax=Shewanella colwelliana TaxID=23 RepID=UPI0022AEBD0F|nr:hypothetical protein [Shewanella colwelliana]MCZ4337739.1 hypothetical protein [Shewanella colwelliana]
MTVLSKEKIGLVLAVCGLPALGYFVALNNPYTEQHLSYAQEILYSSPDGASISSLAPLPESFELIAPKLVMAPAQVPAQAQGASTKANEEDTSSLAYPDISYFANGEYEVFARHPYLIAGATKIMNDPGYSDWSRGLESNFGTYLEREFDAREIMSECNEYVCIYQGKIDVSKTMKLADTLFEDLHEEWWTEWGTQLDLLPVEEGSEEGVFFIVKNKV